MQISSKKSMCVIFILFLAVFQMSAIAGLVMQSQEEMKISSVLKISEFLGAESSSSNTGLESWGIADSVCGAIHYSHFAAANLLQDLDEDSMHFQPTSLLKADLFYADSTWNNQLFSGTIFSQMGFFGP